jgi:hypothetical protein
MKFEPFARVPAFEVDGDFARPDEALERRVRQIWDAEKQRRGDALFDGTMLSVSDFSPARWRLERVPYRYFLAQMRVPELKKNLGVLPLAITGMVTLAEGKLMGRRSRDVVVEPGVVEFAPAGGLDQEDIVGTVVDPLTGFRREWREEIGFDWPEGGELRVVGRCPDPVAGPIDLIVTGRLDLPLEEVVRRHRESGSHEYEELVAVPAGGPLPSGAGGISKSLFAAGLV